MTTQAPQDQAQLSWAHTLRPFATYADAYQGVSAAEWIMLFEGDNPLDANAGTPGYSPFLLRGLPVPPGARIQLWLPHLPTINADPTKIQVYSYHVMYRFRNLTEYQTNRGGWHLVTGSGVTDTTPVTGGVRTLKPAAYRSFAVQQTEPAPPPSPTVVDRQVFHLRPDDVQPYGGSPPNLPFVPDGMGGFARGVVQQGVLDPVVFGNVPAGMPGYDIVNDVALGDELLLAVSRDVTNDPNYDFTFGGADFVFEQLFATSPNVGIFVMIGKVPSGQNSFA